MLERKLLEEIKRFKQINKNVKYIYNEQEADLPAPADNPEGDAPDGGGLPEPGGLATDTPTDMPPSTDTDASGLPPEPMLDSAAQETEEVDVTDLVNMSKNIKNKLETSKAEQDQALEKMQDVFSKLDTLERKLASMDNILSKIDQLGSKIEDIKPPTPQEKLEMRSLDSYPFNQKPQEFFNYKQEEMRNSGKNEYVLTKNDIENYSKEQISKTFNPYNDEQDFRY